jgi:hypothetical protein
MNEPRDGIVPETSELRRANLQFAKPGMIETTKEENKKNGSNENDDRATDEHG